MKVIDLLNKIANGEYPIIKDGINKYEYSYVENDYLTGMGYNYEHYFSNINNILNYLNDEVEIIEEPQEHKIPEKLDKYADVSGYLTYDWSLQEKKLKDKINEILDYLEDIK